MKTWITSEDLRRLLDSAPAWPWQDYCEPEPNDAPFVLEDGNYLLEFISSPDNLLLAEIGIPDASGLTASQILALTTLMRGAPSLAAEVLELRGALAGHLRHSSFPHGAEERA